MSKMRRSDFSKWLGLHITFPVYISPTGCLVMKTISRVVNVFLRQTRAVGWTREPSGLKHPQAGCRIRKGCQLPECQHICHTLRLRDGGEGKELRRINVISSLCSHRDSGRDCGWVVYGGETGKSSDSGTTPPCLIQLCVRLLLLCNKWPQTERLKSTPIS